MSVHKLLIIDDDDDIRESLVALLHGQGYDAAGSRNALDALTLLAQGTFVPDAILLDLFMPAMSGEQFDQTIQRHPAWSTIPVIICSAGPVPPQIAATAFGVLTKPFDLDRLLELVRAACASR